MCKCIRKRCIIHEHINAYISYHHIIYIKCHIYIIHTKTFLASVKDPKHVVSVSQQKLPKKENVQRANKVATQAVVSNVTGHRHSLAQMPPKGKNRLQLTSGSATFLTVFGSYLVCFCLASGKKKTEIINPNGDETRDFLIMNPKISIGKKTSGFLGLGFKPASEPTSNSSINQICRQFPAKK